MQHNNQVRFQQQVELTKDPEVTITGIQFIGAKLCLTTQCFGYLYNSTTLENDCLLTVQDYLLIIDRLERQFKK